MAAPDLNAPPDSLKAAPRGLGEFRLGKNLTLMVWFCPWPLTRSKTSHHSSTCLKSSGGGYSAVRFLPSTQFA